MSKLGYDIFVPVIGVLISALILWLVKPIRKLVNSLLKNCWHFITLSFATKKRINSLENQMNEKTSNLQERLVILEKWRSDISALVDAGLFVAALISNEYISSFSLLIELADRCSDKGNEPATKCALVQAINCLKNITPPLTFKDPEQEVKILHSLEKIGKRSNVYLMEIEQIEKLLREKKYPLKTTEKNTL